jgi:hypothetical protein
VLPEGERPVSDSLELDEATQKEFERLTRAALQTLKDRGRDSAADQKAREVISELRSIIGQIESSERPQLSGTKPLKP